MHALLEDSDFRSKLRLEKERSTYAALEGKYRVNRWYLWQIIHDDGYKIPPKIAVTLGVRVYLPAPVCPKCGQVHVTKRCTATPRRYRDLFDMPRAELRKQLENREAI